MDSSACSLPTYVRVVQMCVLLIKFNGSFLVFLPNIRSYDKANAYMHVCDYA